jgi:hypothetical protein
MVYCSYCTCTYEMQHQDYSWASPALSSMMEPLPCLQLSVPRASRGCRLWSNSLRAAGFRPAARAEASLPFSRQQLASCRPAARQGDVVRPSSSSPGRWRLPSSSCNRQRPADARSRRDAASLRRQEIGLGINLAWLFFFSFPFFLSYRADWVSIPRWRHVRRPVSA